MAEKIEAILARGILNTRPRDYYDVYILNNFEVDYSVLSNALWQQVRIGRQLKSSLILKTP